MQTASTQVRPVLLDGSLLITEALARAGAEVFIGYPITPANLLYRYAARRFPISLPAPDEITALQWMSGFAAAGKMAVTATSFPGFALMVESINMAYMMELPLVVVLAQRLGPATGTATLGADGDLLLLYGALSGGYPLATLCISSFEDCWELSAEAVRMAVRLRTPVVLLTSLEMVMTARSFDAGRLPDIAAAQWPRYREAGPYRPYAAGADRVPPFVPVGDPRHRVRLTASTHDAHGVLQNDAPEAIQNTVRLQDKLRAHLGDFTHLELHEEPAAETLVVAYGATAASAREAVGILNAEGIPVSLLVPKTLFPVPEIYLDTVARYRRVIFAEENLNGQLRQIWLGAGPHPGCSVVGAVGRMITPREIVREVTGG